MLTAESVEMEHLCIERWGKESYLQVGRLLLVTRVTCLTSGQAGALSTKTLVQAASWDYWHWGKTWNGVTVSRAKEPPAVHNSVQGLAVTWERLATTGCYLVSQYPPTSTDVQSGAAGLATVQQPGDQMNTGQAELQFSNT